MNRKDASQIPQGDHCYTVVELTDGEVPPRDIALFGKQLRELSYRPGLKEVCAPTGRK